MKPMQYAGQSIINGHHEVLLLTQITRNISNTYFEN